MDARRFWLFTNKVTEIENCNHEKIACRALSLATSLQEELHIGGKKVSFLGSYDLFRLLTIQQAMNYTGGLISSSFSAIPKSSHQTTSALLLSATQEYTFTDCTIMVEDDEVHHQMAHLVTVAE